MAQECIKTMEKVSKKEKIKQMRIKILEMESKDQDTTILLKEIVKLLVLKL